MITFYFVTLLYAFVIYQVMNVLIIMKLEIILWGKRPTRIRRKKRKEKQGKK